MPIFCHPSSESLRAFTHLWTNLLNSRHTFSQPFHVFTCHAFERKLSHFSRSHRTACLTIMIQNHFWHLTIHSWTHSKEPLSRKNFLSFGESKWLGAKRSTVTRSKSNTRPKLRTPQQKVSTYIGIFIQPFVIPPTKKWQKAMTNPFFVFSSLFAVGALGLDLHKLHTPWIFSHSLGLLDEKLRERAFARI